MSVICAMLLNDFDFNGSRDQVKQLLHSGRTYLIVVVPTASAVAAASSESNRECIIGLRNGALTGAYEGSKERF